MSISLWKDKYVETITFQQQKIYSQQNILHQPIIF